MEGAEGIIFSYYRTDINNTVSPLQAALSFMEAALLIPTKAQGSGLRASEFNVVQ